MQAISILKCACGLCPRLELESYPHYILLSIPEGYTLVTSLPSGCNHLISTLTNRYFKLIKKQLAASIYFFLPSVAIALIDRRSFYQKENVPKMTQTSEEGKKNSRFNRLSIFPLIERFYIWGKSFPASNYKFISSEIIIHFIFFSFHFKFNIY